MLPNFLGIGAPKCATTWLFECLRAHPDAYVAERKEVAFLYYGSIEGRLPEYEQHFKDAGSASAVGEFSTRYLASERAPVRAAELLPGCKLIVSLRAPPEQIYSHYWHLRRQNFHRRDTREPVLSFEQAIESLPEMLLKPAYYFRHITNWLKYFDRSHMHIIVYDDIESKPVEAVRGMYEFLGLDTDFRPENVTRRGRIERRGTTPRGQMAEKTQRVVYTALVRGVYTPIKSLLGVRRAERIKSVVRARELLELAFQRAGYPPMAADTRAMLCGRFEREVEALSEFLGRDLSHWIDSPVEPVGEPVVESKRYGR